MKKPFNNIPKTVTVTLTIENMSYMELAISHYMNTLIAKKEKAVASNDTTVNVDEVSRRIKELSRTRRAIVEALDE